MSVQHQDKGFWTKIRTSTNKISSSLANLSIRSESDGDSPNSTLIHKALMNHYVSKNEHFPSWLGEEEPQQHSQRQNHHHHQAQAQANSTSAAQPQDQIRQPVQTQRIQTQQPGAGTSRFASRFSNDQVPSRSSSRFASASSTSTGSSADQQSNGSRFANNARPTGPERSDSTSGSAMKDRLKRNNYRNNFGI